MSRDKSRRSPQALALLRALAAGLLAAGTMTFVVVASPAPGSSGAAGPGAVAYAQEEGQPEEPGGGVDDPPVEEPPPPAEEPTAAPPTLPPVQPTPENTVEPTPQVTRSETTGPTTGPTTEPTTTPGPGSPGPGGPGNPGDPGHTDPPGQPGPVVPGKPRIGVWVTTTDVQLGTSYYGAGGPVPARLLVTVTNTGEITERIAMRYTLPDGLTDNGTPGCVREGGNNYRCGAWTATRGARWSAEIKVLVAPDAWKKMPLMGSVKVLAVAPREPSLGGVQDNEGFAVLFPAGPPAPGVALDAGELRFGVVADTAAGLQVKLRNTGSTAAQGKVEVILPDGVQVDPKGMPKTCRAQNPGRRAPFTECQLGRIEPRRTGAVSLPVVATIETQRLAPLSGAAIGILNANGVEKRIQMSFRITAVAAESTPPPATPQATGSQGTLGAFAPLSGDRKGDMTGVQKTALALVGVSILLVMLALALATTSLRRRMEDDTPVPAQDALPNPPY